MFPQNVLANSLSFTNDIDLMHTLILCYLVHVLVSLQKDKHLVCLALCDRCVSITDILVMRMHLKDLV